MLATAISEGGVNQMAVHITPRNSITRSNFNDQGIKRSQLCVYDMIFSHRSGREQRCCTKCSCDQRFTIFHEYFLSIWVVCLSAMPVSHNEPEQTLNTFRHVVFHVIFLAIAAQKRPTILANCRICLSLFWKNGLNTTE